jgi:hypothetical protein
MRERWSLLLHVTLRTTERQGSSQLGRVIMNYDNMLVRNTHDIHDTAQQLDTHLQTLNNSTGTLTAHSEAMNSRN